MKRMNRISICFVSIVCLLLLAACGNRQIQDPTDTSEQSTGQKLENTTPQQSEKTDEPQPSTGTPAFTELHWKDHIVKSGLLYDLEISDMFQPVIIDYDSFHRSMRLTYEIGTSLINYHKVVCNAKGFSCRYEKISFSEEFFTENSLLIVNIVGGVMEPIAVKDLRYENGVLFCDIDYYQHPAGTSSQAAIFDHLVFIELDTVLPADTEIKVNVDHVTLSTPEEFTEAREAFANKLEKL